MWKRTIQKLRKVILSNAPLFFLFPPLKGAFNRDEVLLSITTREEEGVFEGVKAVGGLLEVVFEDET